MAIRSKRINSRDKGKRGERAFRDVLREAGYLKARRGQQYSGEQGNPDVVCEELPSIHWEVKVCETSKPYTWLEQVNKDLNGRARYRIVAHKRNGREWIAFIPMADLLEIVRRSDLPKIDNDDDGEFLIDAVTGAPYNGKGNVSLPLNNQCMGCQAGWPRLGDNHKVVGGYPGELVGCMASKYK